jgi:Flp pilus assembly pilin Flp
MKKNIAQSIIEYVVLLAIIALAIGGMRMYVLRAVKAKFQVLQEQIADTHNDKPTLKNEIGNGVVQPIQTAPGN